MIAEAGTALLGDFISTCEERDYGDASTKSLRLIYDTKLSALRLELSAMLDMRTVVKITYEMEGDRLEILLLHWRIELLRALGRSIRAKDDVLPNLDAVLRQLMVLKAGVTVEKHFHGHGLCAGSLKKKETINSTLYPAQTRSAWLIEYDSDGHTEHFEEEELRSGKHGEVPNGQDGKPVTIVRHLAECDIIINGLLPGFKYLEDRITGTCESQYSLVNMYRLCQFVRAFDPSFAAAHVDTAFVEGMVAAITPLNGLGTLNDLKLELPFYLAASAAAPVFNRESVADYSEAILG